MKRSPWTESEVRKLHDYMNDLPGEHRYKALWNPLDPQKSNISSRIISSSEAEQKKFYTSLGVNLFPATDDKPFMEHYLQFGRRDLSKDVPVEFRSREKQKIWGVIPNGDFPFAVILAESALLAFLFVLCPLGLWARSSVKNPGFKHMLGYFGCLGFGFIVVEICLMKRYVLFLGNPAYSITTILVALLLGAGLGSVFSQYLIDKPSRSLKFVLPVVLLAILAEILLAPVVFQAFLHHSFTGRVLIASALLLPLGFIMGMPFPLGLQLISKIGQNEDARRKIVAWAWGINGYMTVVGSALAVFIALFWGFKSVLAIGMAAYLCALLLVLSLGRQRA